ncbi:ABC transporter substrate-binding protein [Candidatus Bipolaricaulota bacterium]|nr:ABC transporter substrate-binding protein [Candidatus Bipolaricaulota bacterium]
MRKKALAPCLLLLTLGLILSLSACGPKKEQPPAQLPEEETVTTSVIDDRGREITIESQPNRIVVAGIPLYTEILIGLGALDRLIAVAASPDNPPEVADLETVGPSFSPNVEVILSLEPDLVLGPGDWGGERPALEAAGITVLNTPYLTSIPDIFSTIRTVATAVGSRKEAKVLIGRIAEEIITIESTVLGEISVKAAFLYAGTPDTPPYAAGSGAIENELILRAGGKNVFSDVQGFPQVSFEEILSRDPEVIFTDPSQIENITNNALLQGVSAVKDERVYGIKASHVTSTKVAKVLRVMSGFLHPEE